MQRTTRRVPGSGECSGNARQHRACIYAGLIAGFSMTVGACAVDTVRQEVGPTFFPPLPQTPRVQFLTSISTDQDVGPGKRSRFREFVVGADESRIRLGNVRAVAHGPGKIYVIDKSIENVISIELETGKFDIIRDLSGGRLANPAGLFVSPDGYQYVADADRKQVVVFNERGEFSATYEAAQPFMPVDVVGFKNRLYVSDYDGNQVVVFDTTTGDVLQTIGGIGQEEGFFRRPLYLTIDGEGNLFVVDSLNFRIQMFDADGVFLKTFGWYEAGPGGLARPKGIDVDRSGHLYSVDAAFGVVQIFDVESTDPLLFWGRDPGPGSTYLPTDISIDYDNVEYFSRYAHPEFELEYVIYQSNPLGDNKLNVLGFGNWTGESRPIRPTQSAAPPPTEGGRTFPSLGDVVEPSTSELPEESDTEPN